jgi:hypothetical protein
MVFPRGITVTPLRTVRSQPQLSASGNEGVSTDFDARDVGDGVGRSRRPPMGADPLSRFLRARERRDDPGRATIMLFAS